MYTKNETSSQRKNIDGQNTIVRLLQGIKGLLIFHGFLYELWRQALEESAAGKVTPTYSHSLLVTKKGRYAERVLQKDDFDHEECPNDFVGDSGDNSNARGIS